MAELDERDAPDDPLALFSAWYADAQEADAAPRAMALATAAADGRPSVRTVELQDVDGEGFVFYTGSESRKGRELAENPRAALCFYWHESRRQVRVEGPVARVALDAGEAAAAARGAARQGEPVAGRGDLEARVAEARRRYGEGTPLPTDWGAYRLVADAYEFWQYREDKLHDRLRYRLGAGGWELERLFP